MGVIRLTIDQVDCHWGKVPVQCLFSYGPTQWFPFVLVRLWSDGVCGWGESLHYVTDAFKSQLKQLPGTDLASVFMLSADREQVSDNLHEAVDIAARDLLSRARQQPFHALLGSAKRRTIPLMPTIFAADPESAAVTAKGYGEQQMKYLKVKLSGNLDVDLPIIQAVRAAVPHLKHCVGDANEGYVFEEIRRNGALRELKAAGLTIIEDPCAATADDLSTLRSDRHPRLMLDMSVRTRSDLRKALDAGAADMINLHPCQQGSFSEAITRTEICEARGVTVWLGGTGFLGVGSAAYQHLASAIGISGPCGEIGGHFDHGMPSLVRSAVQIKNGFAHLSDEPGHGAEPIWDDELTSYVEGSCTFVSSSLRRSAKC